MKTHTANIGKQSGGSGAFTLTELCVVIAVLIILATVTVPALENANEPARRIQCAGNLRQIGAAMNIYCAESKDYLPICGWRFEGNPWETAEACRMDAFGSSNVIYGFENLALLFRTKVVNDARLFYCPATTAAPASTVFSYDSYITATSGWPSIPANFIGNPYVRMGYSYYPQLRTTETIVDEYGVFTLPKQTFSRVNLEFGPQNDLIFSLVTPAKLTDINPKKSITTDLLQDWSLLSHKEYGSPAGVNALFPDGHVAFQNTRTHNVRGSSQPFDPNLWDPLDEGGVGPLEDPDGFRIIMNGFQP